MAKQREAGPIAEAADRAQRLQSWMTPVTRHERGQFFTKSSGSEATSRVPSRQAQLVWRTIVA